MGEKDTAKHDKQPQLNPNWAQLCQKLKIHDSKTKTSVTHIRNPETVLGKRKERSDAETDESRSDLLIPTSSDFSVTDALALDCEMVGVGHLGNKSALGRIVLVNKWRNVVYDEYVRPMDYIVDFRTHISGIRPRDLKKAKDFGLVQNKVAELIKGKILVGHALRNDLKVLLLSHPKKDVRDTSEYKPYLKEGRSKALRHLAAEFLGVKIQNGQHCPIEDARAAMLLYQNTRREWERSVKDFIKLKKKQKKGKHKKKAKEQEASDSQNAEAPS